MKTTLLSILFFLLFFTSFGQVTRYVIEGGVNAKNGTNWSNASDDIQAMINASSSGDQIFIAIGTYKPNRRADDLNMITVGDRANAFVMKNGVKLYGGFDPINGIDDLSDVRILPSKTGAPESGSSILSGDFNNDDVITGGGTTLSIAGNGENAHHVVIAVNTSVSVNLDGFTITGGNANNSNENISLNGHSFWGGSGGGIYSWASTTSSTVTLTNCEISGNSASVSGGGVYCWASYYPNTATVNATNSSFNRNFSTSGGSIYVSGTYTIANVLNGSISGSSATQGGGMYVGSLLSSNISINSSNINGNAAASGGGINSNVSNSTSISLSNAVTVTGSDITGNSASNGGGIYAYCSNYSNSSTNVTVENSNIDQNLASFDGGGIYSYASSSSRDVSSSKVSIIGSKIIRNSAAQFGGGVYSLSLTSTPSVTTRSNVLAIGSSISGNSSNSGSGIFSGSTTSSNETLLTNTTLAGNIGFSHIHFIGSGTKKAYSRNSIVFGNKTNANASSIIFNSSGTIDKDIQFSLVQGESEGNGNLDGNSVNYTPLNLFLDAANGNYSLNSGSAGINLGKNDLYEATDGNIFNNSLGNDNDLNGNPRVYDYLNGGVIDMGAYEYQGVKTLPVELKNFIAFSNGNRVKLDWSTFSETNNKEFIISSSTDKNRFKEIFRVPAVAISTKTINNYVGYDTNPVAGNNYYRLEQVDKDGKIVNLGERIVKLSFGSDILTTYPNPTKDILFLELHETKAANFVQLMDLQGKVLQTHTTNAKTLRIDIQKLPKGVYLVKYTNGEEVQIKKIVKE
ncbi:hypothetical protein D3C87_581280 [compost metagenome]